ncbi:hypothetical protein [Brevibacterium sp. UCMA 11752]|uniref:hypothetical protein n=1 Tax=Brevibacterium sp. UCMA 11752 TaxID=2745946 RepID=UPI001F450993|nr:hypothetical protein [Brevibacterium sp. UCMA 11752]MCF2589063.1 hypothetical protein [Brevibacterium sp. UCMA 11752]
MIVRHLDAAELGTTIALPILSAPRCCRKGTLTNIIPNHGSHTSILIIGALQHVVPNGVSVYVEQTVVVIGL